MQKKKAGLLTCSIVMAILGFSTASSIGQMGSQGPMVPNTRVSDQELLAFAKVYARFQEIRFEYGPKIKNTRDPKKRREIKEEGNSKVKKVLEEQGLTAGRYNLLFERINSDEELREKALKLIEKERTQF